MKIQEEIVKLKIQLQTSYQDLLIKAGLQYSIGEYIFKYFLRIVVSTFGAGVIFGIIFSIQMKNSLLSWLLPLIFLILGMLIVAFYPILLQNLRKEKINNAMPILITYMGGISSSKASRDQLFANVSAREASFGIAALEIRRIRTMAIEWNFGYITAIKKVSKTTASKRFGDFLSRFSQALDAGENLEEFFKKEQTSSLNEYISDYKRRLKSLETLNDAFVALSTSMSFMSITFLLMMYLFGGEGNNVVNLFLILGVMQMVNITMMLAFVAVSPKDDLILVQRKTAEFEKVLYAFLISVAIFMPILAFITAILKNAEGDRIITLPIFMIIFGISMIVPGIIAEKFEDIVKRRDDNFPVFIRTLGGTTALLGGSIFESVNIISREQFGPLTEGIKLLYTQARFGIDPSVAWQWFSDSTCSNIIDRFLRIFTSSMDIGGNSSVISKFISVNVEKISKLRRDREQVISVFKGTMLPLTAINVGTMIFMKDVLRLLEITMSALDQIQGMNLQLGNPPDIFFTDLYFSVNFILIPIFACLAIIIPQRGTWMKITRYLSQYYIIVGVEIIVVGQLSRTVMQGFGVNFSAI